jgi:hypothetical protein
MPWESSEVSYGKIAHRLFSTTMHRHIPRFQRRRFQDEKASLPWVTRRILLIWLQLTSGCFQNSGVF